MQMVIQNVRPFSDVCCHVRWDWECMIEPDDPVMPIDPVALATAHNRRSRADQRNAASFEVLRKFMVVAGAGGARWLYERESDSRRFGRVL